MRVLKSLAAAVCAVTALVVLAAATPARAQEPHYLRGLADLRTARDYIKFVRGGEYLAERRHAVAEINSAIDEVKHAAWDDGKNTRFAPPDQGVTDPWRPLREAQNALHEAHRNVAEGVDRPENAGLRDRAILHIEEAERTVSNILMSEHH